MNIAELVAHWAASGPDRTALVQGDRTMTYGELDDAAARVGAWLRSQGVQQTQRVLYYSGNSIDLLITYLGAARIGAVFAPVNAGFKLRELSYVAANAGAVVAFVSEELLGDFIRYQAELPALAMPTVVVGSEPGEGRVPFEEVLAFEGRADIAELSAEAPALISYTSGSTSHPKPVLRSHGAELWSARTYADVWDYRRDDRALVALPLSWAYGLSTTTSAMLAAGCSIELLSHFNPVRVLDTIERSRITLFAGTSTMFVKMLDVHRKESRDLSSLRNCYVGGEPINRAVTDAFEALIGRRIWEGYAATECFPLLVTMPREDVDAPADTCGRLVPGGQLRLVDGEGRDVADGEVGEALLLCPGRMTGYYGEPELTASKLTPEGWFRSGDLLRRDPDGFYFVVGRASDMIIRGGANIAPSEVESALVGLEGVLDATVVSVPDVDYGEALVAFVTTDGREPDEQRLRDQLGHELASYKVPSHFLFDVVLPEGSTGKKDRRSASELALRLVPHA